MILFRMAYKYRKDARSFFAFCRTQYQLGTDSQISYHSNTKRNFYSPQ